MKNVIYTKSYRRCYKSRNFKIVFWNIWCVSTRIVRFGNARGNLMWIFKFHIRFQFDRKRARRMRVGQWTAQCSGQGNEQCFPNRNSVNIGSARNIPEWLSIDQLDLADNFSYGNSLELPPCASAGATKLNIAVMSCQLSLDAMSMSTRNSGLMYATCGIRFSEVQHRICRQDAKHYSLLDFNPICHSLKIEIEERLF